MTVWLRSPADTAAESVTVRRNCCLAAAESVTVRRNCCLVCHGSGTGTRGSICKECAGAGFRWFRDLCGIPVEETAETLAELEQLVEGLRARIRWQQKSAMPVEEPCPTTPNHKGNPERKPRAGKAQKDGPLTTSRPKPDKPGPPPRKTNALQGQRAKRQGGPTSRRRVGGEAPPPAGGARSPEANGGQSPATGAGGGP